MSRHLWSGYTASSLVGVVTVAADTREDGLALCQLMNPAVLAVCETGARLRAEIAADLSDATVVWASACRIASRGWQP